MENTEKYLMKKIKTKKEGKEKQRKKKRINHEKIVLEKKIKEAIKNKYTNLVPAFIFTKTGQKFYLTTPEQLKYLGLYVRCSKRLNGKPYKSKIEKNKKCVN